MTRTASVAVLMVCAACQGPVAERATRDELVARIKALRGMEDAVSLFGAERMNGLLPEVWPDPITWLEFEIDQRRVCRLAGWVDDEEGGRFRYIGIWEIVDKGAPTLRTHFLPSSLGGPGPEVPPRFADYFSTLDMRRPPSVADMERALGLPPPTWSNGPAWALPMWWLEYEYRLESEMGREFLGIGFEAEAPDLSRYLDNPDPKIREKSVLTGYWRAGRRTGATFR